MADRKQRPRDGNGRFYRTIEDADRDQQAARLRAMGYTFERIAAEVGYDSRATAYAAVQRVLRETVREAGDELRTLELERLDAMQAAAVEVLERRHVTVSNGKVIQLGGEPLEDDGPVLAAIDRMIRIQERRARLLGLDAPVRANLTVTDEMTARVKALAEELAELGPET